MHVSVVQTAEGYRKHLQHTPSRAPQAPKSSSVALSSPWIHIRVPVHSYGIQNDIDDTIVGNSGYRSTCRAAYNLPDRLPNRGVVSWADEIVLACLLALSPPRSTFWHFHPLRALFSILIAFLSAKLIPSVQI